MVLTSSVSSVDFQKYAQPLARSEKDQKIKQAGFEALGELGVCLAIDGAVSAFVGSSADIAKIFGLTALQNVLNGNVQKIGKLFWNCLGYQTTPSERSFRSWVDPALFYFGTGFRGLVLVHEAGHFFATKAVYQNLIPEIKIPLVGGYTSFSWAVISPPSFQHPTSLWEKIAYEIGWTSKKVEGRKIELTELGERLGLNYARGLVSAGGPIFTVLSISGMLMATRLLKDRCPKISAHLNFFAYAEIVGEIIYCLMDLYGPDEAGDFANLYRLGIIHPLTAATAYVALPILINKGMDALQYFFGKSETVLKTKED